MSILATIKKWFFGETPTKVEEDAGLAPYKMEPPTLDLQETAIFAATPNWPFPSTKPEDGGVAKVAEAAPAKKPKAKPAAIKATKPKAEAKPKAKPAAKPEAEAKPKAVKAVAAKPKASKKA